jgi:methionyl-tRNA formyltransferase
MKPPLRVVILGYPDNPVGHVFLKTFLERDIVVSAIVVERKKTKSNWDRFKKKIKKDGFFQTLKRTIQVYYLRSTSSNIVYLGTKNHIPIHRVDRFNSETCAQILRSLHVDILAIASAPILKDYIFETARLGCLNAHPGWLPAYRGLGANAYAVKNGEDPGVTVHFIDAGIDTGRIIVREKTPIMKRDTIANINDRSVRRGAELMADVIDRIAAGTLQLERIDEPVGKCYRSMPYREVKKLNRKLRKVGG